MKKIVISLFIISYIIILCYPKIINSPKYIEKEINKNVLYGTIISKNINDFEIYTDNDSIYKINCKIENNIGDNIKIIYTNNIDDKNYEQNINIINIYNTKKENNEYIYLLNNMSVEEKIGQLLIARVPSTKKTEYIKEYNLSGYILFRRDVIDKTKEELTEYIKNFQAEAKIPLFIAIDEEGGSVSRLSLNEKIVPTPFKSSQELFEIGGYDAIKEDTINKTNLLNELGININFAPVADISNDKESYIYNRTFGKDPIETSKYIETIFKNQTKEVTYTLKHFPGYANNLNTHTGISIDNRTYDELISNDFLPFIKGIKNDAKLIMISHNIMTAFDNTSASISPVIHNILRNNLNYHNIIITDDLSMNALKNIDNLYVKALKAGNNLLIVSNIEKAYNEIYTAYQNSEISETLINKLVIKNLILKKEKKLLS